MKQGKIYLYNQYVGLLTTIKEKQDTMKKILLSFLAAIGLSTTGCSAQASQASQSAPSDSSAKTVPSDGIIVLAPQAFIDQAKADTTSILLDVRTSKEYAEGHLAGSQQLDYLNPEAFNAGIKQLDKSRTYYIYCRSGKRSHGACLKMQQQGFKVYDMEGGILNWTKLGMPVER